MYHMRSLRLMRNAGMCPATRPSQHEQREFIKMVNDKGVPFLAAWTLRYGI